MVSTQVKLQCRIRHNKLLNLETQRPKSSLGRTNSQQTKGSCCPVFRQAGVSYIVLLLATKILGSGPKFGRGEDRNFENPEQAMMAYLRLPEAEKSPFSPRLQRKLRSGIETLSVRRRIATPMAPCREGASFKR